MTEIQFNEKLADIKDYLFNNHHYEYLMNTLYGKQSDYLTYEINRIREGCLYDLRNIEGYENILILNVKKWCITLGQRFDLYASSNIKYKWELAPKIQELIEALTEFTIDLEDKNLNTTVEINAISKEIKEEREVAEFNKPLLKQKQVLLLMHYLRKYKAFRTDLNDTEISNIFAELTGFKAGQLRKGLSEVKKEDLTYSKEQLNELNTILEQVSKDVSKLID